MTPDNVPLVGRLDERPWSPPGTAVRFPARPWTAERIAAELHLEAKVQA